MKVIQQLVDHFWPLGKLTNAQLDYLLSQGLIGSDPRVPKFLEIICLDFNFEYRYSPKIQGTTLFEYGYSPKIQGTTLLEMDKLETILKNIQNREVLTVRFAIQAYPKQIESEGFFSSVEWTVRPINQMTFNFLPGQSRIIG